jgi:lipid-binding SYLF domain-containing protein
MTAEILSYSRAKGVFAGVSLEGSTLRDDGDANKKVYGKEISAEAIVLEGSVKAPPAANSLQSLLQTKSPKNLSK